MSSVRDSRRPHDLYRFYDADDRLLYVGISLNAAQRASQHKAEKSWWSDVRRMEVTPLGVTTRFDAEQVERSAIEDERPLHNIVHNSNRGAAVDVVLTWCCELCGEAIDDGDGYIELPASERRRYAAEMKEWQSLRLKHANVAVIAWDEEIDLGELMQMPTKAHWWAVHRSCDPNVDGGGYWFDVARIRTQGDVLSWVSQLMSKRWLDHTDWDRLIGRITFSGSNAIVHTKNM